MIRVTGPYRPGTDDDPGGLPTTWPRSLSSLQLAGQHGKPVYRSLAEIPAA
jgi:hypothetical protein